jgi:hypothetical protein
MYTGPKLTSSSPPVWTPVPAGRGGAEKRTALGRQHAATEVSEEAAGWRPRTVGREGAASVTRTGWTPSTTCTPSIR